MKLEVIYHDPSINVALGAEHRKYLRHHHEEFDLFVYHEDDIVLKNSHLYGFLHETKKLHELMPENGLSDYCIGLQRYRHLFHGENGHQNNYGEQDIFEQDLLEETPDS